MRYLMEKKTKLIFLDVDGVLNCHSTKDRCHGYIGIDDEKVSLLKQIATATGAEIVLSSTWRYEWFKEPILKCEQNHFANYLDSKMNKQEVVIIDKTDDIDFWSRGLEIKTYLERMKERGIKVEKYIILDDEIHDFKERHLVSHLIQTSFLGKGLEEKHVRRAIKQLC